MGQTGSKKAWSEHDSGQARIYPQESAQSIMTTDLDSV